MSETPRPLEGTNYWEGDWYQDIKTMVQVVAASMRQHGVDPTLITPEDAWAHYQSIVGGHWQEAARLNNGVSVLPPQVAKFLAGEDDGRLVFMSLWRHMDIDKLLSRGGFDPNKLKP